MSLLSYHSVGIDQTTLLPQLQDVGSNVEIGGSTVKVGHYLVSVSEPSPCTLESPVRVDWDRLRFTQLPHSLPGPQLTKTTKGLTTTQT